MATLQKKSWAADQATYCKVVAAAILELRERQAQGLLVDERAGTDESFRSFVQRVSPSFQFYRHIDVLCDKLQAVADGEIKRLIIQMPPRHGKTQLASRLFTAYYLYRYPDRWVGLASYAAGLAEMISREARNFFRTGGGTISQESSAVDLWSTLQRGGMWAVGVNGGATGKGYHLGIVDDPVKDAAEADSEAYRAHSKDWWDSVFNTRAEPGAAQVIIQTRWSLDDLTGFILQKEDEALAAGNKPEGWHVVDLPAIAIKESNVLSLPASCTVEPDWREEGEALCPERYPLEELEKLRASTAQRWWLSLFQQRPTVDGGNIFLREYLRFYEPDELPNTGWARLIASADCTFKDSSTSDFVAITVWGQRAEGFFLLDCFNQRIAFTPTLTVIDGLWQRWRFAELLVEDAANGPAVIDTLKRRAQGFTLRAVRPMGGKVARANAAAPQFEMGRVWLPKTAPWLQTFTDQLLTFPSGKHDDMVDSTTQAINHFNSTGPMRVSTVSYGRATDAEHPVDPFADADTFRRRHSSIPGFR